MEKYKIKNKTFDDAIEFLTYLHSQDFNKIKDEIIEIKCPLAKYIDSSDIYQDERLCEVMREKPFEIIEAIIKELKVKK